MKSTLKNRDITILLVSDNRSSIHEIKVHLEKTMGVSCHIRFCPGVTDCVAMVRKDGPSIDIVLLDLGLIGTGLPREVFRHMGDIVCDIPIIVFTEKENHELALLVMEEGAADNVTRGQFSTDPYKLRDAIEYSLARDKISKSAKLRNTEALNRLGRRDAANFKILQEQGEANLKAVKKNAALMLEEAHGESAALLKEKDEIIFWMGGGYSVNKTPG